MLGVSRNVHITLCFCLQQENMLIHGTLVLLSLLVVCQFAAEASRVKRHASPFRRVRYDTCQCQMDYGRRPRYSELDVDFSGLFFDVETLTELDVMKCGRDECQWTRDTIKYRQKRNRYSDKKSKNNNKYKDKNKNNKNNNRYGNSRRAWWAELVPRYEEYEFVDSSHSHSNRYGSYGSESASEPETEPETGSGNGGPEVQWITLPPTDSATTSPGTAGPAPTGTTDGDGIINGTTTSVGPDSGTPVGTVPIGPGKVNCFLVALKIDSTECSVT